MGILGQDFQEPLLTNGQACDSICSGESSPCSSPDAERMGNPVVCSENSYTACKFRQS